MSDEMIAQGVNDAVMADGITCPQASAIAGNSPAFPAEPGKYCTSHTIRIHGCQSGCFL